MSGRGRGKSNESNESSDVSNSDSESESDMDQSQNSQELDDLLHTDTEAGMSDDSCRDPNYSPSTTPTKGKKRCKSPEDSHTDTATTSKYTPRSHRAKAKAEKPIAQRKEIENTKEVLNRKPSKKQ